MLDLISELKAFVPHSTRLDMDELHLLSACGRVLESEYTTSSVDVPEWLVNQNKAVRRDIKNRNADAIAQKLRAAKARLETLKTPDQKRVDLQAEIAALEAKLVEA